jgi:retron-type reverse transcriptase
MIPKPGENLSEVESYRPISSLPIMSKLFEKLILKRLKPIIAEKHLVPTHQFGFRKNHSTLDQVHHITEIIEKTLENKGVCSAVFLDIAQAFDRVWHRGLLHKLRSTLPDHFYLLLKFYLTNRFSCQTWRLVLRTEADQGWCPTGKCTWASLISTLY